MKIKLMKRMRMNHMIFLFQETSLAWISILRNWATRLRFLGCLVPNLNNLQPSIRTKRTMGTKILTKAEGLKYDSSPCTRTCQKPAARSWRWYKHDLSQNITVIERKKRFESKLATTMRSKARKWSPITDLPYRNVLLVPTSIACTCWVCVTRT